MFSVCIIGSEARRTQDRLSDRDVLLVGRPTAELRCAHEAWQERGWNVSVFDRLAFSRLAEVQSLFVQHVKLEGRLVRDDEAYLQSTLEAYRPKPDYVGERNDALRAVGCLPHPSGNYWHDLCLGDIVSVLCRNAAILHFATSGRYCFGFEELVGAMTAEFDLGCEEEAGLLALRRMKYSYRARIDGDPSLAALPKALDAVRQMAIKMGDLRTSSVEAGITSDDYLRQRLMELEFVRESNPLVLDRLPKGHALETSWQAIKGAGGYPRPKLH